MRTRSGFSLIELLFVVLIAGVLGTLAFPRFSEYLRVRNVMNARSAFGLAAGRARAAAVERGDVVVLWAQPSTERIMVVGADGADTLLLLDFRDGDTQADLLMDATSLTVCYVPRGFAHPACGDGASLPLRLGFGNAADTLWSVINAVGQVEPQ